MKASFLFCFAFLNYSVSIAAENPLIDEKKNNSRGDAFIDPLATLELSNSKDQAAQESAGFLEVSFVTVGCPKNRADIATGLGGVPYIFSISRYEVTARDYCVFLNAVARGSDPYGLYNEAMSFSPGVASILCVTTNQGKNYIPIEGREMFPIVYVNLYSAARYCNWLENGMPVGEEGIYTTERGSYDLTVPNSEKLVRTEGAQYFLPTENEWYKAAYFNSKDGSYYTFPNRSCWSPHNKHDMEAPCNNEANYDHNEEDKTTVHLTPVGYFSTSMSPFGAFDMGGNVEEWTETPEHAGSLTYNIRGGSWQSPYNEWGAINDLESVAHQSAYAKNGTDTIGFRLVKAGASKTASPSLSAVPDTSWLTPQDAEKVMVSTVAFVAGGVAMTSLGKSLLARDTVMAPEEEIANSIVLPGSKNQKLVNSGDSPVILPLTSQNLNYQNERVSSLCSSKRENDPLSSAPVTPRDSVSGVTSKDGEDTPSRRSSCPASPSDESRDVESSDYSDSEDLSCYNTLFNKNNTLVGARKNIKLSHIETNIPKRKETNMPQRQKTFTLRSFGCSKSPITPVDFNSSKNTPHSLDQESLSLNPDDHLGQNWDLTSYVRAAFDASFTEKQGISIENRTSLSESNTPRSLKADNKNLNLISHVQNAFEAALVLEEDLKDVALPSSKVLKFESNECQAFEAFLNKKPDRKFIVMKLMDNSFIEPQAIKASQILNVDYGGGSKAYFTPEMKQIAVLYSEAEDERIEVPWNKPSARYETVPSPALSAEDQKERDYQIFKKRSQQFGTLFFKDEQGNLILSEELQLMKNGKGREYCLRKMRASSFEEIKKLYSTNASPGTSLQRAQEVEKKKISQLSLYEAINSLYKKNLDGSLECLIFSYEDRYQLQESTLPIKSEEARYQELEDVCQADRETWFYDAQGNRLLQAKDISLMINEMGTKFYMNTNRENILKRLQGISSRGYFSPLYQGVKRIYDLRADGKRLVSLEKKCEKAEVK